MYLNIKKAIYCKPSPKIILNSEKLRAFPPRFRTGQRCPLLPILLNIVLAVLTTANKQEKEISI